MIEKIQLTCLLIACLSYIFVATVKAEDVNNAVKFIVLAIMFSSVLGSVALTLIRIWA